MGQKSLKFPSCAREVEKRHIPSNNSHYWLARWTTYTCLEHLRILRQPKNLSPEVIQAIYKVAAILWTLLPKSAFRQTCTKDLLLLGLCQLHAVKVKSILSQKGQDYCLSKDLLTISLGLTSHSVYSATESLVANNLVSKYGKWRIKRGI